MKTLHIANLNCEILAESGQNVDLNSSFHLHPNFLQLQFLPRLYSSDPFLTTCGPSNTLQVPPKEPHLIEPWGHCPQVKRWADKHGHIYHMPPPSIVHKLMSKRFTFERGPRLPHSKLIQSLDDLHFDHYPIVIKSEFGFSGRGMRIYHRPVKPDSFIMGELKKGRVLIAEPWVERQLDFSSQYLIDKGGIKYLGSSLIESDKKGRYHATITEPDLAPWKSHFDACDQLLSDIQEMGYFGHIGVDAFMWKGQIHPIVEINPRKTMSYVAIQMAKGKKIAMRWGPEGDITTNLMPSRLHCEGKEYIFPFRLNAQEI